METRQRAKAFPQYIPMYKGTPRPAVNSNFEVQRIETEDHSNDWFRFKRTGVNNFARWGRLKDIGGPFLSQKAEIELEDWSPLYPYFDRGRYGIYSATTRLYPSSEIQNMVVAAEVAPDAQTPSCFTVLDQKAPAIVGDVDIDSLGSSAIDRVRPTSPVFDGATTVAELISERKFFAIPGRAGSLSGEYLNLQLGILPTVGAVQEFYEAASKSEDLLRQLERDSGRLIRRRYEFPEEVSTVRTETLPQVPPADVWNSSLIREFGPTTTVTRTTTKRWFSGAFTYFLPKAGWGRKLAELEYLYGIKPGIDTAWELVPLSFVADYFVNIGDVLGNLNAFAFDGLVMPYGYMMISQKREVEVTSTWNVYLNSVLTPVTVRGKITYVTKQRRRANPYGFGVSDNDLSLRQMSILAALGISRA